MLCETTSIDLSESDLGHLCCKGISQRLGPAELIRPTPNCPAIDTLGRHSDPGSSDRPGSKAPALGEPPRRGSPRYPVSRVTGRRRWSRHSAETEGKKVDQVGQRRTGVSSRQAGANLTTLCCCNGCLDCASHYVGRSYQSEVHLVLDPNSGPDLVSRNDMGS
jgi:hypothetical protein